MATLFDPKPAARRPTADTVDGDNDSHESLRTERGRLYRVMWEAVRNLKLHKAAYRRSGKEIDRRQMEQWAERFDDAQQQVAAVNRRILSSASSANRGTQ